MYRTVLWTPLERERVGRFGRMALKRVISCMESEGELKSFLMKVKKESERAGLIFNIQKTKIMASGSIHFSSVQSLSGVLHGK